MLSFALIGCSFGDAARHSFACAIVHPTQQVNNAGAMLHSSLVITESRYKLQLLSRGCKIKHTYVRSASTHALVSCQLPQVMLAGEVRWDTHHPLELITMLDTQKWWPHASHLNRGAQAEIVALLQRLSKLTTMQ